MKIMDDLINASNDVSTLQNYLSDNFEQVYDFFIQKKHSELEILRDSLNKYIKLNKFIIINLNIENKINLAFISLLLVISESLGLVGSFRFLYDHLKGKHFNIGGRLEAASLYLIGIKTADDYINRYEAIFDHLQLSSETEEDNTDKVLMTMVNYYAQVIHDFGEFNINKVLELKGKIEKSLSDFEFSFLHSQIIRDVLNVDLRNFSKAYSLIHSLLDSFLGRDIIRPDYKKEFLIETGSEYCTLIASIAHNFMAVRQISVNKYQQIKSDSIFKSLGRGVAILTEESQLYAYMNSYGNMHYEKLIEAFKTLPKTLFEREANVFDWGCGQAMASMTYFDFLNHLNLDHQLKNISLIEPSEIALKRATLHISNFSPRAEIITINKDLDSLVNKDFIHSKSSTNLHLFSNILDIDTFSLSKLLNIIEGNFPGINYFICVSPYINDIRTCRIDSFLRFFSRKKEFQLINSVDNGRGEWKGDWTRVVRVFKVSL